MEGELRLRNRKWQRVDAERFTNLEVVERGADEVIAKGLGREEHRYWHTHPPLLNSQAGRQLCNAYEKWDITWRGEQNICSGASCCLIQKMCCTCKGASIIGCVWPVITMQRSP